jgi:hypothetical protein
MRKFFRFLNTIVLTLFLSTLVWGQTSHKMYLSAPTTTTYLNEIIMGDTTATGARKDTLRVYVLQRGGTWFFNGTIQNAGWALDVEADTGSGEKPKIYNLYQSGSNPASIAYATIPAEGNVTLKNLFIDGILDLQSGYGETYGYPAMIISYSVAGFVIDIEGCVFVNTGQSVVATYASQKKVTLKDNIFAIVGEPPTFDTGCGRVLDLRNTSCDSVIIENNTMMNGIDRVVRHLSSVGRLNNFIFQHNTVYEYGGSYGLISLGAVGNSVTIKDNLLVDPMAFGADTSSLRQWDFREAGEYDANGKVIMSWILNQSAKTDTVSGKVTTTWDIANNYWHVTPQIQAAYDSIKSAGWMPNLWAGRHTTDQIKSYIKDTTKAFIEMSSFSFSNKVPAPMVGTVIWHFTPLSLGGAGGDNSGGTYVDYERHLGVYYLDTLNLSYPSAYAAYTGGTSGLPVGDLNWFPAKKAIWEGLTDVKVNQVTNVPTKFALSNAYPNPFNPSTTIKFDISKASNVKLSVFNILGQKIITLVNNNMKAGSYNVVWDGKDGLGKTVSSGIYLYRLESGSFSATKKMILMK